MARAAEQPIDPEVAKILTNPKVMGKLGKGVPGFDRAGLLAGIFAALSQKQGIDGQNALAQVMVDELFAAKPGAMSRTRILDSICRLLNWHSDDVHAQPVEEMSEEELKNAISASLPGLKIVAVGGKPRKPKKFGGNTTSSAQKRAAQQNARYRQATGEEIRQRREAVNLRASDLAMQAGINKGDLFRMEQGFKFLPAPSMAAIAEVLGVPLGDWKRGQFAPGPVPQTGGEVIPEPEEDLEAGMDEPCEPDL